MVKYCQFWKDCHQRALVKLKYCGITVCKDHYLKNIEARVEKAITHYHMKDSGPNHWLVPLTGSVSSQVLLEIIAKTAAKMSETPSPLKLTAIYVDLGISPTAKGTVLASCAQHSIDCQVIDLRAECGVNASDIASLTGGLLPVDEYSAVESLKMQVLCKKCIEIGATRIATENSLVDEATGLFKKFLGMDVCELAREHSWERSKSLSAHLPLKIRPLIEISDEEILLYAKVCEIKFDEKPEILLQKYDPVRKHLLEIELDRVGNMLNIVRRFHKVFMPMIESVDERDGDSEMKEVDERDTQLIESLIPLSDVVSDEDQVAVCKKCGFLGGDGERVDGDGRLCRACMVLEAVEKAKKGGEVKVNDAGEKKGNDIVHAACIRKKSVEEDGNKKEGEDEFKYFITTDVRGIRAKRKDRMKEQELK